MIPNVDTWLTAEPDDHAGCAGCAGCVEEDSEEREPNYDQEEEA